MRTTLLGFLAVAAILAGCGAGDPVISMDSRHNGHFPGGSPTEADIAGR